MKMSAGNTSDGNILPVAPAVNVSFVVDDPNKKIRKPYTITKSRESWTEQEHDKFLEALQLFDRDWKKIEAFIGSKTVIQIRSHAQKYFLKVQKNGTSEHLPPPRPKRKAAHPYPHKASSKNAVQSSVARTEAGFALRHDSFSFSGAPVGSEPLPSLSCNVVPQFSKDNAVLASVANNCSSSSNDSTPCLQASSEMDHKVKVRQCGTARVIPDFAQVYGFIGSIFDPTATDHLQRLRKMEPINVETVLMLMKNLCVNLVSPESEYHRKLLTSYKVGCGNIHATGEILPA